MSDSMSAKVRGFMAKKVSGFSSSLATVSCLYGTEPITNVGRSLSTRWGSSDQQSPRRGSRPTAATSAHHFVTPTSWRRAPSATKIEVALGASETIRWLLWFNRVIVPSSDKLCRWRARGERRRLCGKEAPDVAAEDFSEVATGRFGNLRHVSRSV